MKYYLCFLLALCSATLARGQAFAYKRDYEKMLQRSRDRSDSLYYPTLLNRFQQQDSAFTVKEMLYLMIGYTGQPGFKPYLDLETEKRVYRLNNEEKYAEAIGVCDTFLQRHPLNQAVIIEKAYAFHQRNNKDSAMFYKEQFGRIMAAMDWSNNGRNPEEAIFSIGPYDGRNFIDKYYRADLGQSGSAEDKAGNFCAKMEMQFKRDGRPESVVLYFAIQHAVNTTADPQPQKVPVKK